MRDPVVAVADLWDAYDKHVQAERAAAHWSLWWDERNRRRAEIAEALRRVGD